MHAACREKTIRTAYHGQDLAGDNKRPQGPHVTAAYVRKTSIRIRTLSFTPLAAIIKALHLIRRALRRGLVSDPRKDPSTTKRVSKFGNGRKFQVPGVSTEYWHTAILGTIRS